MTEHPNGRDLSIDGKVIVALQRPKLVRVNMHTAF